MNTTPLLRRKYKAKARPVDFFQQPSDHECALLGAMGYSTAFIMQKTGLSQCQVTYRLAAAGLTKDNGTSRMDFRNGTSPFSEVILRNARPLVDGSLSKFIRKHIAT